MDQFARSREGQSFFAKFRELVTILGELVIEMRRANDLKEKELNMKEGK